jgi:hypothetical protein
MLTAEVQAERMTDKQFGMYIGYFVEHLRHALAWRHRQDGPPLSWIHWMRVSARGI